MGKLQWDQTGERFYETGVDQGVLYLADGRGVPWNGLTAVDEASGNVNQTSYYIDGVRYFTQRSVGDYSATLKAFTYPDEFMEFDGYQEAADGLILDSQPVLNEFGLSYRTRVGNDIDGTDHGYKIHLAYHMTAVPSSRSFGTMGDSVDPMLFSWTISGTPEVLAGYRPTCHVIIDSRKVSPAMLAVVEEILYGSDISDARLPTLFELVDLLSTWAFGVVDNGNGTWTVRGPIENVKNLDKKTFMVDRTTVAPNTNGYTVSS